MAFNRQPTLIFPSYGFNPTSRLVTISAEDLVIPPSDLDPINGDSRNFLRAIIERYYLGLSLLPVADKPKRLTINKANQVIVGTNVIRQPYTINFDAVINADNLLMAVED